MGKADYIKIEEFQQGIEELEHGYNSVLDHLYNIDINNGLQAEKQDFVYFQIDELAYEKKEENMEDAVYALYATAIPICVVFKSFKGELKIYFGTYYENAEALYDILNGSFWVNSRQMENGINGHCELSEKKEVFREEYLFSGIIRGGIKKRDKKWNRIQ